MFRKALLQPGLICFLGVLLCLVSVIVPPRTGGADPASILIANPGFEEPVVSGVIPGWRQTYGVGERRLQPPAGRQLGHRLARRGERQVPDYRGDRLLRLGDV